MAKRLLYIRASFNPDIATTFFRAGLIEAWGRGTIKIINECRKANLPDPEFKYDSTGFMIEFKGRTVEKTVDDSSIAILKLIRENPQITSTNLQKATGLSRRGIEWNINKLKKENRLQRIGPAKGGHWKVIEQK